MKSKWTLLLSLVLCLGTLSSFGESLKFDSKQLPALMEAFDVTYHTHKGEIILKFYSRQLPRIYTKDLYTDKEVLIARTRKEIVAQIKALDKKYVAAQTKAAEIIVATLKAKYPDLELDHYQVRSAPSAPYYNTFETSFMFSNNKGKKVVEVIFDGFKIDKNDKVKAFGEVTVIRF